MSRRRATLRERWDYELEQVRSSTFELIKEKLQKRKIELTLVVDKRDVHNLLNSFLVGQVFEQDMLNEFWDYYFKLPASLREVVKAYVDTLVMLLEKTTTAHQRIFQLTKDKQRHKQNHDYNALSMATQEVEDLICDNAQFMEDIAEMSKPFALNFLPLIEKYKPENQLKERRTGVIEEEADVEEVMDLSGKISQEEVEVERSATELGDEEKYYRMSIYLFAMLLIMETSTMFDRYNTIGLLSALLLALHSLFDHYLYRQHPMNIRFQQIDLTAEHKLTLKQDKGTYFLTNPLPQPHSYDNYAYSSFVMLLWSALWEAAWIALHGQEYYQGEGLCHSWRYSGYVVFTSGVSLLMKLLGLLVLLQVANFQWEKVFNRQNFYLPFLRFANYDYTFNTPETDFS